MKKGKKVKIWLIATLVFVSCHNSTMAAASITDASVEGDLLQVIYFEDGSRFELHSADTTENCMPSMGRTKGLVEPITKVVRQEGRWISDTGKHLWSLWVEGVFSYDITTSWSESVYHWIEIKESGAYLISSSHNLGSNWVSATATVHASDGNHVRYICLSCSPSGYITPTVL